SPARLKTKVTALAEALDPRDVEDRHTDAAAGRRVIKTPQEDGMASIWALLPADDAATVWAAITAHAEQRRRTVHTSDAEAGRAGTYGCGQPEDRRSADQRRADALTGLARDYLTRPTTDPVTGRPGPPPTVPGWAQVQVKLSAELLLGTGTEPAQLRGHGPIPASMAIRLAADAQWQRIIYDPATGTLLEAGTARHDPPPALREYVLARDGGCSWANCAQTRVDLDHIVAYPAGPTAAGNLDAKCRHHHRTKQRWDFHTRRHQDGTTTITTPTGHAYTSPARDQRPPPVRKPPPGKRIHELAANDDDPPPY
ncbi:MAG: HNH endonuclease, partial [Actinomycetota bacterium]|nr:HNH endonuclease [Actinomycetota bacterium]